MYRNESFFSSIAVATVLKKDKIRVQNVKFAGKEESQDEFYFHFLKNRKNII